MLIQILRKLRKLIFFPLIFEALFIVQPIEARPKVGILSVNVGYPSKGMDWLEIFLQEELSLQFQLFDRFSVISPDTMSRWNMLLKNSGQLDSISSELKKTEINLLDPDLILRLSIQKVLNKISVNFLFSRFKEDLQIKKIKKIYTWTSPDKLIASLLNDLKNSEKFFKDINHFPFEYSWDGIKNYYLWRQKPLPKVNSQAWIKHKMQMEALLINYPELSPSVKYYRALLSILESSQTLPANVKILNYAENDIIESMKYHPGNGDHNTLLSLLYYLKNEVFYAKQQANIANKLNHSNGLALILYGLTIGKTAKNGEAFIKKGLRLYPFFGEAHPYGWQPYHILVEDLKPWLIASASEKILNYEKLMSDGKQYYESRTWKMARQAFEDASILEPELPEPYLYLAQIYLAEQKVESGLTLLKKLRKKFPKNVDITLYLGYAHEKLKRHLKAEILYREVLLKQPEHYRALLRLGSVLIKLGKREEARSFLESLTQKFPEYSAAWWNLGIVYLHLGEIDLAEFAWEETLRLEPENSQVRLSLEQLREDRFLSQYHNL